jgi:hypothetical protein
MAVPSNAELINELRTAVLPASPVEFMNPDSANLESPTTPAISTNSDKAITSAEVAVKKEIKMADIVTGTVSGQVDMTDIGRAIADVRREQEAIGSTVRRETAKEASDLQDTVKTAGWANSDRTGTEADRVVAQDTAYFIAGQSQNFSNATALAALKASQDAQFAQTLSAIQLAAFQSSAASTLAGSKSEAATALGQALIGQQIVADGNATRALVNQLKMDELNRVLVERNAEIVENRGDSHYWQGQHGNSQYAQLTSQVNALNSQLTETRQGMVNFGSMTGVGQSTTANSVR